MKNILLTTVLILSLLSLSACKEFNGTDVDNPFQDGLQEPCNGNGRCMPTPYVHLQTHVICKKVNQCLGIPNTDPQETCHDLLPNQNGLESLIATTAKNYTELNQLYNQKKLTINSQSWNSCLEAIQHLECNSSNFTNTFNVNDPHNFTNIHNILTVSEMCLNIYSLKPE